MKKYVSVMAVSMLLAAVGILARPDFARAHGEEPHPQTPVHTEETSSNAPNAYVFIARPGDNLTVLARRSIQLYAEAKNTSMSPSAILYTETNTVKQLGGRHIDVGERINIPFDTIQKYMVSSRELSSTQKEAWGLYAAKADFVLRGVEPRNKAAAQQAATPRASSTSTDDDATSTTEEPPTSSDASWPWLVMAAGALTITGYFVLQRRTNNSQTKDKKGTIKRLWSPQAVPAVRQGRTKKGTVNTKNKRKRS